MLGQCCCGGGAYRSLTGTGTGWEFVVKCNFISGMAHDESILPKASFLSFNNSPKVFFVLLGARVLLQAWFI